MKNTFRFKILMIMITSILIPIIILTVFITLNSKYYYNQFIDPIMSDNVEQDIMQIESFFTKSKNDLILYSSMISVSDEKDYIIDILDSFLINNDTFLTSYYTSEKGEDYINGNVEPVVDGRTRPWYIDVKETYKFVISEPYIDAITGQYVITLSSPVFGKGEFIGVLGVDFLVSDIIENISNTAHLSDSKYIAKNTNGDYIYLDEQFKSIEDAEDQVSAAKHTNEPKLRYFKLDRINLELIIIYTFENYNSDMIDIGIQMTIIFIVVIFSTILLAFNGTKLLNEPISTFKDKIKNIAEMSDVDTSEFEMANWDIEFYTLFSKFNKLASTMRLNRHKLSKKMSQLQEKNDELIVKNMDLEETYKSLKQIERKVKKSRSQYESILENINGMVWVLDEEGKIVFVNSDLLEALGYDHEIIGNSYFDLIMHNSYADTIDILDLIIQRDYKQIELYFIDVDGKKMIVEASTTRILNEAGELQYIYGVCRNKEDSKNLYYNYNIKLQEQNLIMDLTETASMNVSLNQVIKTIFDKIDNIFGWSVGTIRFLNEQNEFELIARTEMGTDYVGSPSIPYDYSYLSEVLETNEVKYVTESDRFSEKDEIYCKLIRDGYALIFIPVGNNEIGKGVITLTIDKTSMIEKKEVLKSFTNTILIVVERALIYEKLKNDYIRMIKVLAEAGDDKDSSSVGHSIRVSHLCKILGEHLYLDDEEVVDLEVAGLLHDIGKIGISDEYLSAEAQETSIGQEKIKEHPVIGKHMLEDIGLSENILDGIEMHHINVDLTGYPKIEWIESVPLFPRIIHIADDFDNIFVDNRFKDHYEIWSYMHKDTGTKYCPQVMKVLKEVIQNHLF